MPPLSLSQALVLYSWFPLAALLFFQMLIARFYQKFSGQSTGFRLYLLPIILFGAAVVRAASLGQIQNDTLADVLFAAAGVLLLGLSALLYRRMLLGGPAVRRPR